MKPLETNAVDIASEAKHLASMSIQFNCKKEKLENWKKARWENFSLETFSFSGTLEYSFEQEAFPWKGQNGSPPTFRLGNGSTNIYIMSLNESHLPNYCSFQSWL